MRAVIYTRFSPRPHAKDCDSNQKQYDRCSEFAKANDHPILGYFSDDAISGSDLNRPRLAKMLDYLHEHARKEDRIAVIVDCVDRLARDLLVNLTIRQEIEKANGEIMYADGSPCGTSPEARFFMNMMAAVAAFERDRICHRTSRGIRRRMANGEHFGRVPVGWKRDPNQGTKLIPCQSERNAIIFARMWSGAGMISKDIADRITEELGPFRGDPWKARTVRKMIKKKHRFEEEASSERNTESAL